MSTGVEGREGDIPAVPQSFVDMLGPEREMTLDEQLAAIRQEVQQSAVQVQAEKEAEQETAVEAPEGPEGDNPDQSKGIFGAEAFVDESKNILWPGPRRSTQLTVLTYALQFLFMVWIVLLNQFSKYIPNALDNLVGLFDGLVQGSQGGQPPPVG